MLKQSIIYLILSAAVIFLSSYLKTALRYIDGLYIQLSETLAPLFGSGIAGDFIGDVLPLVAFPLIIAALPALMYWVIKRKKMPCFIELTWLLWLTLAISRYLMR